MTYQADDIVVIGAKRTAIGGFQGVFSNVSATDLGAHAIAAALEDARATGTAIDQVYMGCVLPAGLGQAPARQAALAAGLEMSTPATTVNKVCGSGMKTVMDAHDILRLNGTGMIVAGGMESMTNAPYLAPTMRGGARMGPTSMSDHMFLDGLQNGYGEKQMMGSFADNTADRYRIDRGAQDDFALRSLERALAAQTCGAAAKEIAPFEVTDRKGARLVSLDEQPGLARPEKIPTLRPAFRPDGTVTAANASSISDGAAALVLTTGKHAHDRGLPVRARIIGHASHAQEPEWFTTAPVGAVRKLLSSIGWATNDVDLWEVNEAFAVVPIAFAKDLDISFDKINVHGGACAIGHPLGASGTRVVVTLLCALETRGLSRGIATVCIGGGEATAIAIERDNLDN